MVEEVRLPVSLLGFDASFLFGREDRPGFVCGLPPSALQRSYLSIILDTLCGPVLIGCAAASGGLQVDMNFGGEEPPESFARAPALRLWGSLRYQG